MVQSLPKLDDLRLNPGEEVEAVANLHGQILRALTSGALERAQVLTADLVELIDESRISPCAKTGDLIDLVLAIS